MRSDPGNPELLTGNCTRPQPSALAKPNSIFPRPECYSRMPSNLGINRAPFLVLGNFIRNLGLQKGNEGTTGHPSIAIGIMTCDY